MTTAYDGFGRVSSSTLALAGTSRTLGHLHDRNGNRTRLTHADGIAFTYLYDPLGRLSVIHETGSLGLTSQYVLHDWYNARGLLYVRARGFDAGLKGTYAYDGPGRLSALAHDAAGSADDLVYTYAYNPAGQLAAVTHGRL